MRDNLGLRKCREWQYKKGGDRYIMTDKNSQSSRCCKRTIANCAHHTNKQTVWTIWLRPVCKLSAQIKQKHKWLWQTVHNTQTNFMNNQTYISLISVCKICTQVKRPVCKMCMQVKKHTAQMKQNHPRLANEGEFWRKRQRTPQK